jgi:hypothetical protein
MAPTRIIPMDRRYLLFIRGPLLSESSMGLDHYITIDLKIQSPEFPILKAGRICAIVNPIGGMICSKTYRCGEPGGSHPTLAVYWQVSRHLEPAAAGSQPDPGYASVG